MNEPLALGDLTGRDEKGFWLIETENGEIRLLNDTARAIWELCDGATAIEEMAIAIAELTGMETGDALADVARAVDQLIELGLVSS